MPDTEFDPYLRSLIQEYAEDSARVGRWTTEEAPVEALKQIQGLLPAGRDTPNHLFFTITSDPPPERVGTIWVAIEPRGAFVYDLKVFPTFRRKGYAEAAMRELEPVVRGRGAARMLLHVFGDNSGARKLYAKLGYEETNVMMAKSLSA
jgi:ribosomal protein S18 acetylase RimI-like enzyme